MGRFVVVAIVIGMHANASNAHDHATPAGCAAAAVQPALVNARQALDRAPRELKTRVALVDLLTDAGCYEEAVHVLEDGQSIHPRNDDLQNRVRTVRSLIGERQFFEGLGKAELEAKVSRHVLRCTRFGDVGACDEALALKPDALAVLLAKGEALLKAEKPIEALDTYNRAAALDPSSSAIAAKVTAAQALRTAVQQRCTQEDALAACESILRKGAPDEFDLTRRIAILHQSANRPTQALDAYIAANSIRRGDKAVALAIVSLVDSTGRNDAHALAARGSSLVALGRVREAVESLRQAQALTPELPGIASQISGAQRLLQQEDRMRESQRKAEAAERFARAPARTYSNLQPASRAN